MQIPNFDFEKSLIPPDCRFLMGIDEVGRGPWAGPVTIGAFVIDLNNFDPQIFINLKVRDSKKLSQTQRQKIFSQFQKLNSKFKTFSASSEIIDQQGIGHAIESLFIQALNHFRSQYDFCIIDGNINVIKNIQPFTDYLLPITNYCVSCTQADAKCFSVASASICAKVTRDLEMDKYDTTFPHYDFKNNKGYGTPKHILGLQSHGICPIHRLSYKPIKQYF